MLHSFSKKTLKKVLFLFKKTLKNASFFFKKTLKNVLFLLKRLHSFGGLSLFYICTRLVSLLLLFDDMIKLARKPIKNCNMQWLGCTEKKVEQHDAKTVHSSSSKIKNMTPIGSRRKAPQTLAPRWKVPGLKPKLT